LLPSILKQGKTIALSDIDIEVSVIVEETFGASEFQGRNSLMSLLKGEGGKFR
jgi:hypothetical protein